MEQILTSGQDFCRAFAPNSSFRELYDAIVCGVDLPQGPHRQLFIETGLFHLIVVSGAHLQFLEHRLRFLPQSILLPLLAIYCWLTGWGAPAVRAFARRLGLQMVSPKGWTPLQIDALASLLVLSIVPSWIFSRSFIMSWMCSLALLLPLTFPRWTPLRQSLSCYILLFPLCPTSPLTVLWNALIAPWIGNLLFPACLVAYIIPALTPFIDMLWHAFLKLLQAGPHAEPFFMRVPTLAIFWLPFCVHGLLLWGEWKWRKAVAFS